MGQKSMIMMRMRLVLFMSSCCTTFWSQFPWVIIKFEYVIIKVVVFSRFYGKFLKNSRNTVISISSHHTPNNLVSIHNRFRNWDWTRGHFEEKTRKVLFYSTSNTKNHSPATVTSRRLSQISLFQGQSSRRV